MPNLFQHTLVKNVVCGGLRVKSTMTGKAKKIFRRSLPLSVANSVER